MKRKLLPALIVVMLIAVVAASFVILREHKDKGYDEDQSAGTASEQQDADETDDGGDEYAETEPLATLFFASDYQEEEGFEEPSVTLSNILETANDNGKDIDMVVMCGDYTNEPGLYDYQLSPDDSIGEIREVVSSECPDVDAYETDEDADVLLVQGNHDRMSDQITPTGLHEYEDYLVYVLNTEEDFPWKQGKTYGCLAKVRRSSAEMKECFDKLISRGETRPVFIAGHVPLHYTARTSSRHTTGDNLYSSLIFDVVNEAAKSLDIVYLFGHDHSKGWDCYLGGSSVYKAKGDTILIPRFSEEMITTDDFSQKTLRFTYMNAGYTGYYINCGTDEHEAGETEMYRAADETLTGTVFEIYSDRIAVTRYDGAGVHVLGHEGEADPYRGGIDTGLIDEDDYSTGTDSPQEIYLKE